MYKLILVILLLPLTAFAQLDKMYLETEKRFGSNRHYYMADRKDAQYDINLGIDFKLNYNLYSRSKISTTTNSSQFAYAGFDTEFGVYLWSWGELYYRHFSGHALDSVYPNDERFPEDNSIGIRWRLYGK